MKVAPLGRLTLICGSSGGGGSIMTQRADRPVTGPSMTRDYLRDFADLGD